MLIKNQLIKRNNRIITRVIDNGLVALDPIGVKIHIFNPVATCIWQFLWKVRSIEEIINKVAKEFSISPEKAQRDIDSFIEKSIKNKLLFKI